MERWGRKKLDVSENKMANSNTMRKVMSDSSSVWLNRNQWKTANEEKDSNEKNRRNDLNMIKMTSKPIERKRKHTRWWMKTDKDSDGAKIGQLLEEEDEERNPKEMFVCVWWWRKDALEETTKLIHLVVKSRETSWTKEEANLNSQCGHGESGREREREREVVLVIAFVDRTN